MENNQIYLDYNATTPCDPKVVEKMLPYFTEIYGNPANGLNLQGRLAAKVVGESREQIADLIGAKPYEIYFTSGATESDNLAIFGVAKLKNEKRKGIISSLIEHKAVLNSCKKLGEEGFEVNLMPVDSQGVISIDVTRSFVNRSTLLTTFQYANNEIGTLQPIRIISEIAHNFDVVFHCDAAQAVGKIPVNVDELGVDLLSLSSHKIYGPKGIGALYVRGGINKTHLEPIIFGGGQENGLRSGTSNVPGIVGFGMAATICKNSLELEMIRQTKLRMMFETKILHEIPNLIINGAKTDRLPNTSSITFPDVDADALLLNIPELMMGTGSACTSGAIEPSHVLQAIGRTRDEGYRTVRVSIGRFTSLEQIEIALELICSTYKKMSL